MEGKSTFPPVFTSNVVSTSAVMETIINKLFLNTHMRPHDPPRPQNQTDGPVSLAMENLPQSQSKQQPFWPSKNNSIFALQDFSASKM